MDEYATLAQRVVLTMDDVRGCLVLSRDGLVLGAFPEDEEASVKPSWLKFVHVGDARRSFVEFGDQTWAYIHRGPYAAFVVAGTAVRPGVLLDQLEQALLLAEETRAKRDTLRVPDASGAPSGKPRTSLHPAAAEKEQTPMLSVPQVEQRPWSRGTASGPGSMKPPQPPAASAGAGAADAAPAEAAEPPGPQAAEPIGPQAAEPIGPQAAEPPGPQAAEPTGPQAAEPPGPQAAEPAPTEQAPITGLRREPQRLVTPGWAPDEEGEAPAEPEAEEVGEIDRVMLAKEFSGLLQLDADGDEGDS